MNKKKEKKSFINSIVIVLIICSFFLFFSFNLKSKGVFSMDNKYNGTFSNYKFKKLPAFNITRNGYSAVVMNDGNIMFTGGMNRSDEETLFNTEIFDIKMNKFINSENMKISRVSHSSILLGNGNILITGGNHYEKNKPYICLKSAEIYDIKNKKFVQINDMHYQMSNHQMYMLNDGNVLVIYNPNKIELFDVKKSVFKIIQGLNFDNDYMNYKSIYLNDNTILMYPTVYIPQKTPVVKLNLKDLRLEEINIELFRKETKGYNIAKIDKNKLLVTGKNSNHNPIETKIVDISTNEIKIINCTSNNRYYHNSIEIENGDILLFGGYNGIGTNIKKLKSTNLFIIKENKLIDFKNMNYERSFPEYIKLNNKNYVIYDSSFNPAEMLVINEKE